MNTAHAVGQPTFQMRLQRQVGPGSPGIKGMARVTDFLVTVQTGGFGYHHHQRRSVLRPTAVELNQEIQIAVPAGRAVLAVGKAPRLNVIGRR
ncbi:hypothetical protein D3C78_1641470 [compost metagenome]